MGHVHRGVADAATGDLPCPKDQIEVKEIESMRFEATGCGDSARYRWVDGKPVLEEDAPAESGSS